MLVNAPDVMPFSRSTKFCHPVVARLVYAYDTSDPEHENSVNVEIDAFSVKLNEVPLTLGDDHDDRYFYVERFEWGAGNVSYLMTITDEVQDTTFAFLLGGDPLPEFGTLGDFEDWYASVTHIGLPAPGSGFAEGEAIALADIPDVLIAETDMVKGGGAHIDRCRVWERRAEGGAVLWSQWPVPLPVPARQQGRSPNFRPAMADPAMHCRAF